MAHLMTKDKRYLVTLPLDISHNGQRMKTGPPGRARAFGSRTANAVKGILGLNCFPGEFESQNFEGSSRQSTLRIIR